jgi:O-methyltransferase involved in polyketide biosynthesis
MSRDYSKISLTAKLTAYMRQFTDIAFAKDVARLVHARKAFDKLLHGRGLSLDDLLWYAPILEARYKSIGEMINRSGTSQIVEIASGLSLRGLAATSDPRITYIDTDLAEVTREKTDLIAEISRIHRLPAHGNLHLATADTLDLDQLLAVTDGKFRPGEPVAIVQEGLLQYLTSTETERIATNIRALLKKFGGVWITPDFTFTADAALVSDQQRQFRDIVNDATDATMYNNAFDNAEHLNFYFGRLGFQVEVYNQLYLAPPLFSADLIPPAQLDELRPRLRLWVLSLAR